MKGIINKILSVRVVALMAVAFITTGAWAIVPTVVWETGAFGKTKIGSDGKSYSITLNPGNSINSDGNIVIGGNIGATIDVSAAVKADIAVLIEYEGLSQESTDKYAIAGMKDNSNNTAGLRADSGKLKGFYGSTVKTLGSSDIEATSGSGTILMSYGASNYLYGYAGADRANLSGGKADGVRWSNKTVSLVSIGGAAYPTNDYPGWKDLVIKRISLWVGTHIPVTYQADRGLDKLQYYKFPSELVAETNDDYAKWAYADDIITWTSTSQSDIGSSATFSLFDRATGADASPAVSYTGSDDYWCRKYWTKFCYAEDIYTGTSGHYAFPNYLVPGPVLRLAADQSATATKTIGGMFGPLTLGGLIVESGAGEYSFSQNSGSDSTTRDTILGDPTGETETWFDIDENLTFARGGVFCISGTINIDIASGKTLTLQASEVVKNYPKCFAQVGQNCKSTVAGGHLKMHGGGQIVATKLTAEGTCLDFSDLAADRSSSVINGELVVNDSTTYVFPAGVGATFPVATSVTGATSANDQTFTINSHEYKAPLTFSSGNAVFPAVATLNGGASTIVWTAIEWDAKPDSIGASTPVVLNIEGDTILGITSAVSVDKVTFNIKNGATLTLAIMAGSLSSTNGFVVKGGGNLALYNSFALNGAVVVADDIRIDIPANCALTINGALTVNSGKTLTLAPATITGASATILSATSIAGAGTIALSAPTESGYTYTLLETATTRKLVRTPNVAFSYDGTIGATPTGWFTAWGGEGFGDRLRVGPNSDRSIVYEVYHDSDNAKAHPYYDLSARSAFSFALYADVSQVGSDGRKVLASFGNSSAGLVLYRQGDYVRVGRVTSAGFTGGWAAAVAIPASGYHLYTVTYDPNGTIALYLDDGASSSSSSTLGAMLLNAGMQIGGMYQGVPTADVFNDAAFAQGVGMAFAAIRCYDAVLAAGNVEALAQQFPATDNSYTHTVDLNATGKTLTVYSTAFTGSCYLGVSDGALVIPENNTVSVPHVRLQESAGTVTADIYGRLEVTSVSTGPNVHWDGDANNYKGILFGKASGAGTGSVTIHSTGALVAPNAWLQTVFQAGNQTITIDGGLMQVKGLFSDLANKSSLVLQNGGILEVDSVTDRGQSIAANFRYGTFRIASDVTLPNELSTAFTGTLAQPTTLDPYGNTLTLQSAALTGSGDITVNDSSDGGNGKVVFIGGSSYAGRLIMTDANAANIDIYGYTGTVLCQGTAATTIAMFDGFEGTVYFTDDVDATAIDLSGAKVVVADNVIYTATIGNEGAMTLGAGAVAKLVGTTESQIKYDGYVPNIIGSGSVQYWDAAETPVQIVDGYTIDGNSETTGLISGVNLVPYYYVWEIGAGDTAGIATGSDGWSRIDDHVRPVDNKNIAFHIQGTAGQVTTITVDDNATFGSIVVYGTGTAKFESSENKTISVTTLVVDTPVQIGQGAVAVSGIIRDNSAVAFTGTQTISVEITGTGAVYVGDGTTTSDITFAHCNSFAGGMIVKSNAKTTTTSGARADGVGTGFGAYGGTVTVYTGGQVDVANTSGVCYDYVIEDGGESETPALTNSGSVIGIDARQARSLTVNADAIIECPASKGWGLVNNNHDTANLTLKKGTTLTKKGAGTFILCNTDISNSGSTGELPKLVIAEGNVSTENTGSGGAGAWDIDIEDGGKLLLERGIGARNITVKNGGKITMSSSDGWLNGLTALTIDAGGEVDCSGTSRTGNLINATTLTVNGTLNMGTHIGQISATTIAGSGTIVYAGVASKNPAADKIFSTQAGWTGTVKLSAITGDNRICTEFGHSNSHLQLAGAEGYFMASASGTEFSVPVEFVDGTLGYAWKMKSGWTDSSTGRSITLLDTISGTGKIWHPSTSTVGHCYVFKTATGYSGSILIENANGAIIEFGSTAPGQGARSYGSINVASTGSAVIGSGQSWQATNGIKIEGQVTLEGVATMASATTIASGATLVFQDGASLAFTAATTPVTLPVSGTVNINANAMNSLTSEGATIITSTTAFTADDVAKLKSVGHHVFMLDAEDTKKINVYPAVAKVGDTYYTDLATAEEAVNAANPSITIYSGSPADASIYHNLGDSTYRLKNQNVYFVYGAWDATAVFCLADGTVTTVYDGDTVVIDNNFTANSIAVSPTAAPANATNIRLEKSITMTSSADGTILAGTTFTIADGAMLTISGVSRAVTLGAVTFDKAADTGAVTLDGGTNAITLGGNLSGSAPATMTITGTVIATGKTIANTLTNTTGGTIVYDGTLPGTVPTFDSSWTGTVWLKNYTTLTGSTKRGSESSGSTNFEPNSYGNENSTVKLTGVKGYLTATSDGSYTIQPALELEDNGDTPGLLLYNGWGYNKEANSACYTIIRELKGSGTLKADTTTNNNNAIPGYNVLLQVLNWGNFSGTLNMPNKNVVFGSTLPAQSVAEGGGKIFVRSGASVTIPSGKTWTCGTFYVDGTLSAVNKSAWSGAMQVGDSGVLEITRSDDASSNDGDTNYAADVSGSGTLKYSGTGFTVISTKIPASLTVEANKDSGIIVPAAGVTIGSLSGSKRIRSDWGTSAEGGRHLTIKQSRDTTWSGVFLDAADRLNSMIVDPGTSSSGTLTLAGDQVTANSGYANDKQQNNDLIVNGAVKLTGSWVGPITVSGTFGGNGTASSTVTFNAGSTYRYDTNYLTVNGGVVVAAGNMIDVAVADGTTVTADMKLIDWTGNTAPEGYFRFEDSTLRDSWTLEKQETGLFVVARATDVTLNVEEGTTTVADNYTDITITKTGAGTAQLTGTIVDASLVVNAGAVDISNATLVSTVLSGAGDVKITGTKSLTGLTLSNFTGKFDLSCPIALVVNTDVKDAIVASMAEGADYTVTDNGNGTRTITVSAKLDFATNDSEVTVNLPANNGTASTYDISYGKLNGVAIGNAGIKLDNFTGMNRVTPFTLSLDVTIPETIDYTGYADGYGPVLFSFNAGPNQIFIMRKSNGVMAARWYPYQNKDSGTDYASAPDSNSATANKVLELGHTYRIDLRYWGVLNIKDGDTYPVTRGLGSPKTGTTVFVDGVEAWHHTGLRWGSMSLHKTNATPDGYTVNGVDYTTGTADEREVDADTAFHANMIFPTNIVIGAATDATLTGKRAFSGLTVKNLGFINLAGFQNKVGVSTVNGATAGMTASDEGATYWYDYGVTADGATGGYALGEQATYGVSKGEVNSIYSRGVVLTRSVESPGSVTVAMKVNIPAGSAGGTICEIPTGTGSVKVEYDGANDKFKLNGTAQSSALESSDGEHTLVIKYGASTGAYLWVDAEESAAYTIADVSALGRAIGDKIYFGSGSATTAGNGFFAGLGVESQDVEFGEDVYSEETVEAALENECTFEGPLANLPLAERIKFLQAGAINETTGKFDVPVPKITIGGQELTGYAALNAARTLGVYENTSHTLGFSGYDQSSGALTCNVDPAFAGKLSVSLMGSNDQKIWERLEVKDISSESSTVSFNFNANAFGGGKDYMWFKLVEDVTNDMPVVTSEISSTAPFYTQVAKNPTDDGLFKTGETGWNRDVYRIPAMAATPDGQVVMGIFDARYNYQDLGVPLTSDGNNGGAASYSSPDHYTGIDIGGVFSLDGGENWSYPQIMIDVPNATDPKTGTKTTTLTKAMDLGDPCIVYDPTNEKFIMMGITGGGLTTVHNGAAAVDVVTYECSLASVQAGAPWWDPASRTSVKETIETALKRDAEITIPAYKQTYLGSGYPNYQGILEGPGHAFVTKVACGSIPANTVVWPMQYVLRTGDWAFSGGDFAAWKDSSGNWHTTKLVPNSGDGHNYVTQEGCITQLDNGDLLYMCKKIGGGSRPFYKSTDGVNWTFLNEITIAGSESHQGSILRLGSGSDGYSRYAAVFATGTLRSDIKAFIGTDNGSGSVTWDTENPITVWAGATGTADNDGNGPHGNLVYGYNSLVMLDETTLGVLFEAHGHIYFTKIDVSSALK